MLSLNSDHTALYVYIIEEWNEWGDVEVLNNAINCYDYTASMVHKWMNEWMNVDHEHKDTDKATLKKKKKKI